MSMAPECCRLIMLFTMSLAVVLSVWIGVGGCACYISSSLRCITFLSFALINNAPNSASESATDATMCLRISHNL